jgi:hypothetical protein
MMIGEVEKSWNKEVVVVRTKSCAEEAGQVSVWKDAGGSDGDQKEESDQYKYLLSAPQGL